MSDKWIADVGGNWPGAHGDYVRFEVGDEIPEHVGRELGPVGLAHKQVSEKKSPASTGSKSADDGSAK